MSTATLPPTIALVGRPNVGKSTLFNLLADGRSEKAVVHPRAGTTRDVRRVTGSLFGLVFDVLDTAGLEEGATGLAADMNKLAMKAAGTADVILFMVDGREGVTPADRGLAQQVRKLKRPVILLVNKGDVNEAEDTLHAAESLGFGVPLLVSAAHNGGLDGVHEALTAYIQPVAEPDVVEADEALDDVEGIETPKVERPIKLAIVGKPNAGKSTFVNALLGKEAMLAGPMAGLTRDAIGHPFTYHGQEYILVDTPGLRKKAKVVDDLEGLMVAQSLNAIQAADAVVLMVDASAHSIGASKWKVFEAQDSKIADVIVAGKKPLIVVLNKWDMVEDPKACLEDATWQLGKTIHSIHTVLAVPTTATVGYGVPKVMNAVAGLMAKQGLRVGTSKLNYILLEMVERRPPPMAGGKAVKLKFATQVKTNPPTFAFWGNRVASIPDSYKMYLRNQLVVALGLQNLPIQVVFKSSENPYGHKAAKPRGVQKARAEKGRGAKRSR
ncbi:MAG: ribosome biogenesis GTPase Der [Alphaproteobacteria bacterium]